MTSRTVVGSIPEGVTGIFHWFNPSGRTMALASTQPLTEIVPGGKDERCSGLTTYHLPCQFVWKSESLTLLEVPWPVDACNRALFSLFIHFISVIRVSLHTLHHHQWWYVDGGKLLASCSCRLTLGKTRRRQLTDVCLKLTSGLRVTAIIGDDFGRSLRPADVWSANLLTATLNQEIRQHRELLLV